MKVCPYLGKVDDRDTPILFPSQWSCCYRCAREFTPELAYQGQFCLTREHASCALYVDCNQSALIPVFKEIRPAKKRILGLF